MKPQILFLVVTLASATTFANEVVNVPVNGGFGAGNGELRTQKKHWSVDQLVEAFDSVKSNSVMNAEIEEMISPLLLNDSDLESALRQKLQNLDKAYPELAYQILTDKIMMQTSPTGDPEVDATNLIRVYLEQTFKMHGAEGFSPDQSIDQIVSEICANLE